MWTSTLALVALAATPQALLSRDDVLVGAPPAAAGLDAARLEEAAHIVDAATLDDTIRGAVILVARHGRIALHEAYGWRDLASTAPMERDSLFRLASNTKPVVATAVLQLVEQGAFALDDTVGRHIEGFTTDGADAIEIRHLLAHTSGLRIDTLFLRPLLPGSNAGDGLRREVARFGKIGPAVAPGTSYAYSNPGYNTLGALVEVASGLPLERYLAERIYAPLGMHASCNHESVAAAERMSTVFVRLKSGAWRARWTPGDAPDYPFVRASGGMISTARDYATFCQALLQGGVYGGARILSPDSVAAATRLQNLAAFDEEERARREVFYGYGWSVRRDGGYAHSGSDGTFAWVDPRRELVGILFTQSPGACDALRGPFVAAVERAADVFDAARE